MNSYNPYIMQMPQTQDLGGLAPYMQNIANQQAMQNMAMQQAQGLTQDAGRTAQGGMNPLAMAMMLRKGQSAGPAKYVGPSYGTNPAFNNSHFNTMSYD